MPPVSDPQNSISAQIIHQNATAFVEWAREQIQIYIDIFRKQVYNSDVNVDIMDDCRKITAAQSKRVSIQATLSNHDSCHSISFWGKTV